MAIMFPIRGYCEVTQLFSNMGSLEYKSFKKIQLSFLLLFSCQNTSFLFEFFS